MTTPSRNPSSWMLERVGGEANRLCLGVTKIGRNPDSDVQILRSTYVSRAHAIITIAEDDQQIAIQDLKSVNGVYVNNELFHDVTVALKAGDIIGIGASSNVTGSVLDFPIFTLHYAPMRIKPPAKPLTFVAPVIKQEILTQVRTESPAMHQLSGVAIKQELPSPSKVRLNKSIDVITLSDDDDEDTEATLNAANKNPPIPPETKVPPIHVPMITQIKQEHVRTVSSTIKDIFGNTDEVIMEKVSKINPYVYNELTHGSTCDGGRPQVFGNLMGHGECIDLASDGEESDKTSHKNSGVAALKNVVTEKVATADIVTAQSIVATKDTVTLPNVAPKEDATKRRDSSSNERTKSIDVPAANESLLPKGGALVKEVAPAKEDIATDELADPDDVITYVPGSDDEDVEELMFSQVFYNNMKSELADYNEVDDVNDADSNEDKALVTGNENVYRNRDSSDNLLDAGDSVEDLNNCTIWSISDEDDDDDDEFDKVSGWSNRLLSQAFHSSQIYEVTTENRSTVPSNNETSTAEAERRKQEEAARINERLMRKFLGDSDADTDCDEDDELDAAVLLTAKQTEARNEAVFEQLKGEDAGTKATNADDTADTSDSSVIAPKKIFRVARLSSTESEDSSIVTQKDTRRVRRLLSSESTDSNIVATNEKSKTRRLSSSDKEKRGTREESVKRNSVLEAKDASKVRRAFSAESTDSNIVVVAKKTSNQMESKGDTASKETSSKVRDKESRDSGVRTGEDAQKTVVSGDSDSSGSKPTASKASSQHSVSSKENNDEQPHEFNKSPKERLATKEFGHVSPKRPSNDGRHGPPQIIDALPLMKKRRKLSDCPSNIEAPSKTGPTISKTASVPPKATTAPSKASSTSSMASSALRKVAQVKSKIRRDNYQKELERKWLEKSAAVAGREKQQIACIKETRKERLKELAEEERRKEKESLKRRPATAPCQETAKKAKVKVTPVNRGAFLTEAVQHAECKKKSPENPKKQPYKIPIKSRCETSSSSTSKATSSTSGGPHVSDGNSEANTTLSDLSFTQQLAASDKVVKAPTRKEAAAARANRTTNKISFASMSRNSLETEANQRKLQKIEQIRITNPAGISAHAQKKRVRFDDNVQVHLIEAVKGAWRKVNMKDAQPKTTYRDRRRFIRQKYRVLDNTKKIVFHILWWSNEWLQKRLNGTEKVEESVFPMICEFASFDHYKNILFPLMKLEFLSTLGKEYDMVVGQRKPFKVSLEHVSHDGKSRHVLLTKYSYQKPAMAEAAKYDLVVLEIDGKQSQTFAYMSAYRRGVGNSTCIVYEILDNAFDIAFLKSIKELRVQPVVDNIRVEFGAFNAVYQLAETPLFQKIINPRGLANCPTVPLQHIVYKGYEAELNDGQMECLKKSYCHIMDENTPTISLIHGPPGTGKSTVITNLALQLLYGAVSPIMDKKILICAQSNGAVDVIAQRLMQISLKMRDDIKFRVIRYGILEKMKAAVRKISLQQIVEQNQLRKLLGQQPQGHMESKHALREQIKILEADVAAMLSANIKNTFKEHELQEKQRQLELWKSIMNQTLRPDEERRLQQTYLSNANIVCTTLSSCVKLSQFVDYFDVCIIDEATQCTEPWTLMPLKFGISSLVLVGDTQQLPATVLSKRAQELGLGMSMFTRIQRCLEANQSTENVIFKLTTQYRMHPEICLWPNEYFYNNSLENASVTQRHQTMFKPFCILNLAYAQNDHCHNGKITNNLEADFVAKLLKAVTDKLPLKTYSYGVITPYAQHREALLKAVRSMGLHEIMVNTIDSYQGIEKDVIVISNARTNGVGFLSNYQRLNVALTRPRKCLLLCGNFKNLEVVPAWRSLLQSARKRNVYYELDLNCLKDIQSNVITKILK